MKALGRTLLAIATGDLGHLLPDEDYRAMPDSFFIGALEEMVRQGRPAKLDAYGASRILQIIKQGQNK